MVECSNENIWYKKKRKRRKRSFRLFIVFIIFISIFLYIRFIVSKSISNVCSDYAYSYATESVNNAILSSLNDNLSYSNLVNIEKNQSGEIVLMTTDSYRVNHLSREITKLTNNNLENKLSKGIPVPVLAFTGIDLISGYGIKVNYKSVSISSVEADFESKFQSVGINQTLHSIYVKVESKINIHFALHSDEKICKTRVLLSESILVGKVPDVYLNGGLFK